jgi:hypothetical protein
MDCGQLRRFEDTFYNIYLKQQAKEESQQEEMNNYRNTLNSL